MRQRPLTDEEVIQAQQEAQEYREEFESLEDALIYFMDKMRKAPT